MTQLHTPTASPNGTATGTPLLEVRGLHVSVEGKQILRGVDLTVCPGEIHALMGRNGSGKSTLANTIMGHPKYQVTAGTVRLNGEDLLALTPDQRARKGVFLQFQAPLTIPGVGTGNFLRAAVKAVRGEAMNALAFRKELKQEMEALDIDASFAARSLNEGFSGGERKRAEVLQMAMLKPKLAVLDEPDSGLDIDAVRTVSDGVNRLHAAQPDMGILIITHYQRILNYIQPQFVHVLAAGRVVTSGGPELVRELEEQGGYEPLFARLGLDTVALDSLELDTPGPDANGRT